MSEVTGDFESLTNIMLEVKDELKEIRETLDVSDSVQKKLTNNQAKLKRVTFGLFVSLVIDVVLTGILVHGSLVLSDVQDRATTTSCDLYGLLVSSITNPDPAQIDTPEKKRQYDESVQVILNNYNTLRCHK